MKAIYKFVGFAAPLAIVGCATLATLSTNVSYEASKKRHIREGFRNNYPHPTDQSF